MKAFRYLALLLSIFAISTFANAQTASNDYQFQVLDPDNPPPDPAPLNYLDGTPFTVTFSPGDECPTAVQSYAAAAGDSLFGCYLAYNNTDYTFTSIDLIFGNSTGDNQNTNLNGQPADCLTTGAGVLTPAFGDSPRCSLYYPDGAPGGVVSPNSNGEIYELYYFGGAGLAPGDTLVLAEYGPDPSAFGTGVGTVTEGGPVLTPEPSSLLLFSTGALCIGMVMLRRRNKCLFF